MVPLQTFANGVIADVIRRQPASPARTTFAWTLAVGPALARTATVALADRTLIVSPRDRRWAKEIERASPMILERMQYLLGPGSVLLIDIRP